MIKTSVSFKQYYVVHNMTIVSCARPSAWMKITWSWYRANYCYHHYHVYHLYHCYHGYHESWGTSTYPPSKRVQVGGTTKGFFFWQELGGLLSVNQAESPPPRSGSAESSPKKTHVRSCPMPCAETFNQERKPRHLDPAIFPKRVPFSGPKLGSGFGQN